MTLTPTPTLPLTATRRPDWKRWSQDLSTLSGLAALATLLLLIAGGVLLVHNLDRLAETRRLVSVTAAVLDQSRAVVGDVIDAETGQRGYLLTGEERYLRPYREATARLGTDLSDLENRVMLPAQAERLRALRPLIEAKLAELAHTVRLRESSPEDALAVVRTDEGQRLSEEIRRGFAEFDRAARAILADRNRAQETAARQATAIAMGCGLLSLITAGLSVVTVLRRRDVRHLTEQNERLEREVAHRTADLEEANEELEAFAATISHDLRTPIRAIGGLVGAVREDAADRLDPEDRDYLARAEAAAERMDALIEDILGYSRLARQDLHPEPVPLADAVDAALLSQDAAIRAAQARVEVARPLPTVRAHAGALEIAIGNLLSNALKFTHDGEPPAIRIAAEPRPGARIRLWVEDRGIGIPPEHRARIFRPFERLHGREAYPGTGVGLAVVRRIAERLDGACGVEAEAEGSRFWLDLPVVEAAAPGGASPSWTHPRAG
ncbi:CHASE3 domain-containing protein [Roseomonas sp. CCTCC AB2023176]|uniref:sensor histidine kinase n=1 Tax=Roseomonas sp. CCTCC AB2023176 TaxID=3342640 RepID=UPI0035DB231E